MKIKADYANDPSWKVLTVKATLPEETEVFGRDCPQYVVGVEPRGTRLVP